MIDLADAFDSAFRVFSVGDRSGERFHAQGDEPIGNRGRHHADVFRAVLDKLPDEVRTEKTRAAGDERYGALAFLNGSATFGSGRDRSHARGAFAGSFFNHGLNRYELSLALAPPLLAQ